MDKFQRGYLPTLSVDDVRQSAQGAGAMLSSATPHLLKAIASAGSSCAMLYTALAIEWSGAAHKGADGETPQEPSKTTPEQREDTSEIHPRAFLEPPETILHPPDHLIGQPINDSTT